MLAANGEDLRSKPLRERRCVLERSLSGLASPIVLCQQTTDLAVAEDWFRTLAAGGIEGLVIKDTASTYPTRDGQRTWRVDCTIGVVDDRGLVGAFDLSARFTRRTPAITVAPSSTTMRVRATPISPPPPRLPPSDRSA